MVTSYIVQKPGEASNKQSQLISCIYLLLDFRSTYEDTLQVVLLAFLLKT